MLLLEPYLFYTHNVGLLVLEQSKSTNTLCGPWTLRLGLLVVRLVPSRHKLQHLCSYIVHDIFVLLQVLGQVDLLVLLAVVIASGGSFGLGGWFRGPGSWCSGQARASPKTKRLPLPKAGADWLDPNVGVAFCAGEAPVKLNPGAPEDPDAPPKAGVLLFAPKAVALLGPPNWKGAAPPEGAEGAEEAPKLNMPPLDDGAAPESPPLLPGAKGLLNEEEAELPPPPPPNWNPKLPEAEELEPKDAPTSLAAGVVEAPPNKGVEVPEAPPPKEGGAAAGVVEPPKLKMGADAPDTVPPLKALLAGDGSSCFMGLPSSPAVPEDGLGDWGAPNRGFAAPLILSAPLEAPPKLNMEVVAGVSFFAAVASLELGAPNKGAAAGVEVLPNRLLAVVVGFAPNKEVAVVDSPFAADVLGAPKSEVFGASVAAGLSSPVGLAPNSVEDCSTGPLDSAGLLTAPKRFAVGAGVLALSSGLAPNKLVTGLAGSGALTASVAGLENMEPKLGWAAEALDSNMDFFGASSFSLSDSSPPVLSAWSEGVDVFSAGLAAPKRFGQQALGKASQPAPQPYPPDAWVVHQYL
ncbi:hypothetical protein HG531_008058 [Fusarium graminearum]|nr:hypothetical protein HG531_008058 [Fusarium graminearum]